ncbi:EAL domain-containing protein [Dickeya lacustris]|uniref:EAL domain-containing protein n=1 Tax=Dickeya lacustris TaxID=2259638 RepID=A0ABY8GAL1_9GAMM|nr:EAL domain-containing protein [Dickeya lacustris]WFN57019.1 EAL domain-containing protein [Dickeya lacustris]
MNRLHATPRDAVNYAGVNYIISPCFLTARGVSELLLAKHEPVGVIHFYASEKRMCANEDVNADVIGMVSGEDTLPVMRQCDRAIVFLPEELRYLFYSLRQLVVMLKRKAQHAEVMILSRYSPAWLHATLSALLDSESCLDHVHLSRSDISCSTLTRLLCDDWSRLPDLLEQAQRDSVLIKKPFSALTPREFSVLLGLLSGCNIRTQSARQGLSEKTLYHQRRLGLRKLAGQIPVFAAQIPGLHRKSSGGVTRDNAPERQDREFIQAVYCRQIVPVFQPVVDRCMAIQGAEVFVLWQRHDRMLSLAEFQPARGSRAAWRYLIALMLYETVCAINRYEGRLYFSFKIPDGVIDTRSLMHLIDAARQRLHQAQWIACLILELSESVAMSGNTFAVPPLKRLLMMGARAMLEERGAQDSIGLPRLMALSGYKLDIGVVNGFLCDTHERVLINSLIYSCQLSGSLCLAEGVDSWEKFDALVHLGIEGFQGDIISPPVSAASFGERVCPRRGY